MTTANVTDTSRHNGHEKSMQDKTPEEIQLEIARTKSAITEDLRLLSERFSPQHLREGAREVMRDAREEASLLIHEAKEATIGSLIGAKDRAVESVKESVSEKVNLVADQARILGDQAKVLGGHAKHAGDLTVRFVSKNAVAFSLLGVGAGWLLVALRNYRRSQRGDQLAYGQRDYYEYQLPPHAERQRFSDTVRGTVGETARSVATNASRATDRAREEARSAIDHTREVVEQTRSQARQVVQQTSGRIRHAVQEGRANAGDHKLAVVALTVAAGLGLSLLLPVGRRPRRALISAGERVWDEAQYRGRHLAERAQTTAHELADRARAGLRHDEPRA
ncbi:MAG: hypothetical protein JWN48_3189 [Myxococcaceae bacterium]|nr:hypothetical protein [Myxococcaceae bacterium]